jgi:hypothetical protein
LKKTSMYSKTSVRSSAFEGQLRPWMSSVLSAAEKLSATAVSVVAVAAAAHRLGDSGGAGLLAEGERDELPGLNRSSQQLSLR